MKRLHIVGRKNSGKTTLICELIEEFARRGFRVGTVKHTYHDHEVDVPGKDSHRHRTSGASPACFVTRDTTALFIPSIEGDDLYRTLEPIYGDCDFILVEGHLSSAGTKVEVWRATATERPLCVEHGGIRALITDDAVEIEEASTERWARSTLAGVADGILGLMGVPPRTPLG